MVCLNRQTLDKCGQNQKISPKTQKSNCFTTSKRVVLSKTLARAREKLSYAGVSGNIWRTIFLKYDHAITINILGKDTPRYEQKGQDKCKSNLIKDV